MLSLLCRYANHRQIAATVLNPATPHFSRCHPAHGQSGSSWGSPRGGGDAKVLGNLRLTSPRETTTRHAATHPIGKYKKRRSLLEGSRSGRGYLHFVVGGFPLQVQSLYAVNRNFARVPHFEVNPKCPGTRSTATYNISRAEEF